MLYDNNSALVYLNDHSTFTNLGGCRIVIPSDGVPLAGDVIYERDLGKDHGYNRQDFRVLDMAKVLEAALLFANGDLSLLSAG
jgi:hypothetical protein